MPAIVDPRRGRWRADGDVRGSANFLARAVGCRYSDIAIRVTQREYLVMKDAGRDPNQSTSLNLLERARRREATKEAALHRAKAPAHLAAPR